MRKVSGFTFLEVLISLALLSMALMGMDGLQWRMLQNVRYEITAMKAQQLALGLAARQRVNRNAVFNESSQKEAALCLPQGRIAVKANRVIVAWGGLAPSACGHSVIGRAGCIIVAT